MITKSNLFLSTAYQQLEKIDIEQANEYNQILGIMLPLVGAIVAPAGYAIDR